MGTFLGDTETPDRQETWQGTETGEAILVGPPRGPAMAMKLDLANSSRSKSVRQQQSPFLSRQLSDDLRGCRPVRALGPEARLLLLVLYDFVPELRGRPAVFP